MNYDPYSLRRKHKETQSIPTEGAFTKCHQAWDKTVQYSRHGNSSREENKMNSFWRWYTAPGMAGHSPHTRCYSHPQLDKVRFRDAKSLVWMSFSWGQVPVGLILISFCFEKCPIEKKNSYGPMHSIFSTEWGAQSLHVTGFPDSRWTAKRRAHCCCKLCSISLYRSIIHHLENEISDFTSFHNFGFRYIWNHQELVRMETITETYDFIIIFISYHRIISIFAKNHRFENFYHLYSTEFLVSSFWNWKKKKRKKHRPLGFKETNGSTYLCVSMG